MRKYYLYSVRLFYRLKAFVAHALRPRLTVEERNAWNLYLDTAWYGVLRGISATFLSVFAVRLGASTTVVGLLASLPALVNIFWLIPAARIVEGRGHRLPLIVWTGFFERTRCLLIALAPLMGGYSPHALVAIVALTTFPEAMASVAFTSALADLVPVEKRARVVSLRNVLVSLTSTMAVFMGGRFLDLVPFPLNYQLLFVAAFLTSLVSLRYVSRLEIRDEAVRARRRPRELLTLRVRRFLETLWGRADFVRFSVAAFLFHWGLHLPAALYPIYRVRYLGLSDSWIGLLATVQSAVTIVAYLIWGRIMARRGNRPILVACSLGMMLFPVLTGLSTRPEPLLVVSFIGGVAGAGFDLGLFNTLLEVCPRERRPSYVAIYTTLINVTAFLGPMAGTVLAKQLGIRAAFFLAGALRLLGGSAFYLLLSPLRR